MNIEYPKCKYHRDGSRSVVVNTPEQEAALGEEWVDRPPLPPPASEDAPPACESCETLRAEIERMQKSFDKARGEAQKEIRKLTEERDALQEAYAELRQKAEETPAAQPETPSRPARKGKAEKK